jgi:hypothetical protein
MRVAFWDDRKPFTYISTTPGPTDVVYDIPHKIVEQYVKCMDEFLKVQSLIHMFIREQDLRDDGEDFSVSHKVMKFKD